MKTQPFAHYLCTVHFLLMLTDISAEPNILLRRLAQQNTEIKKEEDDDLDLKLDTKYQIDEETPQDDPIVIEDDLKVEPENVDEV